jgi:hypothetical protein
MLLEITTTFIIFAAIVIKFFFGKTLNKTTTTIIKSYFRWFSIYDFADAYKNEEKTFYKISNTSNFIILLNIGILLISSIYNLFNF